MSSILKWKSTRLWFFGAEGERKVKYTINLGKLLSIYKIVIIVVFYRFAMWINNKKAFVKYRKSLAYKCNLNPSFGTQMAQSCSSHSSSRGLRKGDPAEGQDQHTLFSLRSWTCYTLRREPLQCNRTFQNILRPSALFSSTSTFKVSRRFLRSLPQQIKDRSSKPWCTWLFFF